MTQVEDKLKETAENVSDETKDASKEVSGGGDSFAKKLVVPAAAGVGTLAATYAVRKGPDFLREKLLPKMEGEGKSGAEELGRSVAEGARDRLGESGGIAGKALSKAMGGNGDGEVKKTRRLPIQRWTDVAVPISRAYGAWTKFEEFPQFMHRVVSVDQDGSDKISWREKIWFSTREWEGEITDRRKNDRIAWRTTSGMSHKGVVSFHKLDERLTRVMVDMEFEPSGLLEKMASGLRFVKRSVESDLARFKAYVEMEDVEGLEYRHPGEQDEESGDKIENNGGDNGEEKRQNRQQRRQQRRDSSS